jgi:hypothetical protein
VKIIVIVLENDRKFYHDLKSTELKDWLDLYTRSMNVNSLIRISDNSENGMEYYINPHKIIHMYMLKESKK